MKKKFLVLLFTVCVCMQAGAQQVEKNFELGEIIRIAAAYQDLPYLSFNARTIISDSAVTCCDGTTIPLEDTLYGNYKIREGRYWIMVDSVEYVQGFSYNLALYHDEKLIVIGKPSFDNRVMQLSVLDSTFLQAHVKTMSITDSANNIRSFVILFNNESPYSKYQMRYNKNTYMLESITYYVKKAYERENGTSVTAKINVAFTNYSNAEFSNDYFLEEKYIYKDTEGFKTKPNYTGYEIITTADDL